MIEVLVYSKPGYHLCEELTVELERLRQHHTFELKKRNILEDPQLYERYKEEVPVVFINGRKAFKYRLDEKEFLKRLEIGDW